MKKGISLVALVITIIVLIILTAAVILTATNTNIFDKATQARNAQNEKEVYETVQREVLETQLENQAIGSEFATALQTKLNTKYPGSNATASYADGKITINYTLNGQTYQLELNDKMSLAMKDDQIGTPGGGNATIDEELEKYLLGADKTGRNVFEIVNLGTMIFIDEEETIANASEKLKIITYYASEDLPYGILYVKYEGAAYKLKFLMDNYNTSTIEKIYEPSGIEGNIVKFSVDGTSTKTDWLVLYDNGATVDIMSIDTMGSVQLAAIDPDAINETNESNQALGKAINSYNNAIDKINNYCATLITNQNAIAVRSVGSNPDFNAVDTTQTYSNADLATWHNGRYNNVGKVEDTNAERDIVRMSYFSPGSSYTTFGYSTTTNRYFLASRYISRNSFGIRLVQDGDFTGHSAIWSVSENSASGCTSVSAAVRPVVRVLKTNLL